MCVGVVEAPKAIHVHRAAHLPYIDLCSKNSHLVPIKEKKRKKMLKSLSVGTLGEGWESVGGMEEVVQVVVVLRSGLGPTVCLFFFSFSP